jgi:ABC-type dipeptide/oligopeptide/nickel transport system permease subunit
VLVDRQAEFVKTDAVLAVNFIGDGLRDALDPRMKV